VDFCTEEQSPSPLLDAHDIMINLLLACDPNTKIFNDPHCNWIRNNYCLPHKDQESFWSFIGTYNHDELNFY
jgi:hypothetical protein